MAHTFRHSAGFGKRIEYWIIGNMLKEGLDVYVPMVDDDAIDVVIKRGDDSFVSVQIKARSKKLSLEMLLSLQQFHMRKETTIGSYFILSEWT